jgi:hypothetical protein
MLTRLSFEFAGGTNYFPEVKKTGKFQENP